jgi:hypothetical protein
MVITQFERKKRRNVAKIRLGGEGGGGKTAPWIFIKKKKR